MLNYRTESQNQNKSLSKSSILKPAKTNQNIINQTIKFKINTLFHDSFWKLPARKLMAKCP